MKKYIYVLFLVSILQSSYAQWTPQGEVQNIQAIEAQAAHPFLTKDQNDQPVLCWTATDQTTNEHFLSIAFWQPTSKQFGRAIKVAPSIGMQAHQESMAKVGIKKDGTIVAIFRLKDRTAKSRFGGHIYYASSSDQGKTWTSKKRLVAKGLSSSQSFYDIARLANGELGIIWLDARKLHQDRDGSTLYFAQTNRQHQFMDEQPIAGSTCQCCRTELHISNTGQVTAAFRNITPGNIRDMYQVQSTDNGKTFTKPTIIGKDDWQIFGCPHTGPSIAQASNRAAMYTWFTMGGKTGVYYGNGNGNRTLLTASGNHPQTIGCGKQYIITVEEPDHIEDIYFNRVVAYTIDAQQNVQKQFVTGRGINATHAVMQVIDERTWVIAWTKHLYDSSRVQYQVWQQ